MHVQIIIVHTSRLINYRERSHLGHNSNEPQCASDSLNELIHEMILTGLNNAEGVYVQCPPFQKRLP